MKVPMLPTVQRDRQDGSEGPRTPAPGYRERLLLAELQTGRLSSAADARAASRAAQRCGRRDLARRADRVRASLAASHRPARPR
ncbi:MAG: hypothetical protein MSC31_09640 [Solirubrobacteraceae bacterium MAG38_C4-C5]|nr:hypothetical protein [Candidatus Siliceabacter maunaloa]